MSADFERYVRGLAATQIDDKTEQTDRACLHFLLQHAADDAERGALVQHEPRRDKAGPGSPDYKVARTGRIAGYVEVKRIDENLSKILKSDQIKKYLTLTDNLILTDYLEFIWITPRGDTVRARLAHPDDLSGRGPTLKPERVDAVRTLLRGFFSATPARIGRGQDLSVALARRAALLRDVLGVELRRQTEEHGEGRLHALYDVFRRQVFHDLTVGDFADAFAQMLAYGLFLARLNADAHEAVTLENVRRHIPGSFALIRELVRFLEETNEPEYREMRWVIDEVLSIVNGIDLAAIRDDLSFRSREAVGRTIRAADEEEQRLFARDPFLYFYEDFLKAYDPAMRKGRGVYYTPPPVVNFIVRAVDDILKETFGIARGLADHERVTVLDFACGTGTFLLEVFERIFDTIGGSDGGQADQIVRAHLTKNLYGFESLIAPYTIAHLKLSQYLKDKGHPLKTDERLQVFLTNTLEPIAPQRDLMMPALSREVEAAQDVKDKPILVIVGNPPYSAASKNKGAWITQAIEAYKYVDGVHFGERKHWLHDDYVKFIRFAQVKIDKVDRGVVGIIANHSWLDNPTFRAMRTSLMRSFDRIIVLDLHGNAKKREAASDGGLDVNVFDIEQGVAIALFVKDGSGAREVLRGDLWGRRIEKYRALARGNLRDAGLDALSPAGPDLLFTRTDAGLAQDYEALHAIAALLPARTAGIITARDGFAISFDRADAIGKISAFARGDDFAGAPKDTALQDTRGWSAAAAREALGKAPDWRSTLAPILQAPFDRRIFPNDPRLVDWGRWSFYADTPDPPLGLVLTRKLDVQGGWNHAFVVDGLISHHALSMKEVNYFYPLRFRESENVSSDFRDFLDTRYDHHYSPEEILGYIYAILYAPAYRSRYAAFLRADFPRLPFPEARPGFDALSDLGWALVQAHLLKAVPKPATRLGAYHGKGDHGVDLVRHAPEDEAIWINGTQRFAPVPQAVWEFRIGGYQVLDKYLKSRKGRRLGLDETSHVGKVAEALAFTIAQTARIDTAYRAAFPAGDNAQARAQASFAPVS